MGGAAERPSGSRGGVDVGAETGPGVEEERVSGRHHHDDAEDVELERAFGERADRVAAHRQRENAANAARSAPLTNTLLPRQHEGPPQETPAGIGRVQTGGESSDREMLRAHSGTTTDGGQLRRVSLSGPCSEPQENGAGVRDSKSKTGATNPTHDGSNGGVDATSLADLRAASTAPGQSRLVLPQASLPALLTPIQVDLSVDVDALEAAGSWRVESAASENSHHHPSLQTPAASSGSRPSSPSWVQRTLWPSQHPSPRRSLNARSRHSLPPLAPSPSFRSSSPRRSRGSMSPGRHRGSTEWIPRIGAREIYKSLVSLTNGITHDNNRLTSPYEVSGATKGRRGSISRRFSNELADPDQASDDQFSLSMERKMEESWKSSRSGKERSIQPPQLLVHDNSADQQLRIRQDHLHVRAIRVDLEDQAEALAEWDTKAMGESQGADGATKRERSPLLSRTGSLELHEEEVFILQLHRRAKLLNQSFLQTVTAVVESHRPAPTTPEIRTNFGSSKSRARQASPTPVTPMSRTTSWSFFAQVTGIGGTRSSLSNNRAFPSPHTGCRTPGEGEPRMKPLAEHDEETEHSRGSKHSCVESGVARSMMPARSGREGERRVSSGVVSVVMDNFELMMPEAAQVEEGGQGAGQASKLALTQRTRSPRQRRGSWGGEGALVLSTSPASRRDRRNSESSGTGSRALSLSDNLAGMLPLGRFGSAESSSHSMFTRVKSVIAHARGWTMQSSTSGGGATSENPLPWRYQVVAAPVKSKIRMREKVIEYAQRPDCVRPFAANILDPVRTTLVCDGPRSILNAVQWFTNPSGPAGAPLPVVRMKNKFAMEDASEFDGYRDLLICVVHTGKRGLRIIGEVQFHDRQLHDLKRKMHKLYKVKRAERMSVI